MISTVAKRLARVRRQRVRRAQPTALCGCDGNESARALFEARAAETDVSTASVGHAKAPWVAVLEAEAVKLAVGARLQEKRLRLALEDVSE